MGYCSISIDNALEKPQYCQGNDGNATLIMMPRFHTIRHDEIDTLAESSMIHVKHENTKVTLAESLINASGLKPVALVPLW